MNFNVLNEIKICSRCNIVNVINDFRHEIRLFFSILKLFFVFRESYFVFNKFLIEVVISLLFNVKFCKLNFVY